MELLEMMKQRRSIRKYLDQKVEKEKLQKIADAGIFAPSPGGRQGTKIIMLEDADLIGKIETGVALVSAQSSRPLSMISPSRAVSTAVRLWALFAYRSRWLPRSMESALLL